MQTGLQTVNEWNMRRQSIIAKGYSTDLNLSLTDVNECEDDNICEHKCVNRIGSFVCKCLKGYNLMDDGRTCEGK